MDCYLLTATNIFLTLRLKLFAGSSLLCRELFLLQALLRGGLLFLLGKLGDYMQAIGFIVYIVVGLFQLAAIMAGLESWWGLHWIIAAPIAFIVSYIPFVGAIVGMVGAVDVWRWEWWQAGLLFFGGIIFAIVCGGMSSFFEWLAFRKGT